MKVIIDLLRDSDNSYPQEVRVEVLDDRVRLSLQAPSRELDINIKDLQRIVKIWEIRK